MLLVIKLFKYKCCPKDRGHVVSGRWARNDSTLNDSSVLVNQLYFYLVKQCFQFIIVSYCVIENCPSFYFKVFTLSVIIN